MDTIIEIDTSNIVVGGIGDSLYSTRTAITSLTTQKIASDVTIYVQAYNKIEKTKRCIESIIKYTSDIDYDLLLIDNGSMDGTFDYFRSIDFEKKRIIRFTENKGMAIPHFFLSPDMFSRYVAFVANDLIVTTNWLSNMLKIAESDPKIGIVNPMSSNVSNLQDPGLIFSGYEQMQEKAAAFNVSDPRKWQERLRIITLGFLMRKECILTIGLPINDMGFAHNFGDDDMAFRIRRAGYKVILASDTWIHHDDYKGTMESDAYQKMLNDIKIGKQNFRDKYFGIDAWDDTSNYIDEFLSVFEYRNKDDKVSVLGIDVRCGTPILEIKNHLRNYDVFDAECFAFTTEGKYFIDLQTVCGADNVYSGDICSFSSRFSPHSLDYVVIGNDINTYPDPFGVIRSAASLIKNGGQLFISLQNVFNIFTFMAITDGYKSPYEDHALNYYPEEFFGLLKQSGYNARFITGKNFDKDIINKDLSNYVKECMNRLSVKNIDEKMYRLTSERYFIVIDL